jgi:hypothetical protein
LSNLATFPRDPDEQTAFGKEDFKALSAFRYQVRRYLRWTNS